MSGFDHGAYGALTSLHRDIREKFTYRSDKDKWGLVEHWEDSSTLRNLRSSGVTKFTGDCEEFAMVAMDNAMRLGFNARLVTCYTENGEGHCLCEVASSDFTEAYYLDNRFVRLAASADIAKYKIVSVSPWNPQAGETRPWQRAAHA